MGTSIHKSSLTKRWVLAILAGLVVSLVCAIAAQKKQSYEATGIYLGPPMLFDVLVTPSGNQHFTMQRTAAIIAPERALMTGLLTFEGDFNLSADMDMTGSVKGQMEVGTWDFTVDPPIFTRSADGGLWVTKAEVEGSMVSGYSGHWYAHGVAGEVEGMVATMKFTGDVAYDYYEVELLDPHAAK